MYLPLHLSSILSHLYVLLLEFSAIITLQNCMIHWYTKKTTIIEDRTWPPNSYHCERLKEIPTLETVWRVLENWAYLQ